MKVEYHWEGTMRLAWPRFTVRRLMIAVAITAVLIGGSIRLLALKEARDDYLWEADRSARTIERIQQELEGDHRILALRRDSLTETQEMKRTALSEGASQKHIKKLEEYARYHEQRIVLDERYIKKQLAFLEYHKDLFQKYSLAARRPWLTIPEDPPRPEYPKIEWPPPMPLYYSH